MEATSARHVAAVVHRLACVPLSGAMDAGKPVAGIRISREAGTTVRTASYLPPGSAVFCRFLSSRKVGRPRANSA